MHRWISNLLAATCILLIVTILMLVLLVTQAFGYESMSTIRKPISRDAEVVAKVAVDACGTAYPEDRIRTNGWENDPEHGTNWHMSDDSRLRLYATIMEAYAPNLAPASCAQFVSGVLAATIDPHIVEAGNGPQNVLEWLRRHPERYEALGSIPYSQLRPGDIVAGQTHTMIYVGRKTARQKFDGTLGDVAEAGFTTYQYPGITSWSLGWKNLGMLTPWNQYEVFRIR